MKRIRIIGLGIHGADQLTLEGLQNLREAGAVLHLVDPAVDIATLLGRPVRSLAPLYRDGGRDEDNYARIIEFILARVETDGDVAVLLPGHPRLGVTIVQRLQSIADEGILELRVIPGISSFATMVNDLHLDPLERGTLMVDANRLLLFDHVPDPHLDVFIYHVCSVGTSATHYSDPTRDNQVHLLRDLLIRGYAPQHRVTLIQSAGAEGGAARTVDGTIGGLVELLRDITFATTLFIPAAARKSVNRDILSRLAPEFTDR